MITILAWFAACVGLAACVFFVVSQITARRNYTREKKLVDLLYHSIQVEKPCLTLREIRDKIGTISISTCVADPTVEEKMNAVLAWLASQGEQVQTRKRSRAAQEEALLRKEERTLFRNAITQKPQAIASFWLMDAIRSGQAKLASDALQFVIQISGLVTGTSLPTAQTITVPDEEIPRDIKQGLQMVEQQRIALQQADR